MVINKKPQTLKRGLFSHNVLGVHFQMALVHPRWLTKLYAGDAEWPHVNLPIILAFIHGEDHLWSHPGNRTYSVITVLTVTDQIMSLDRSKNHLETMQNLIKAHEYTSARYVVVMNGKCFCTSKECPQRSWLEQQWRRNQSLPVWPGQALSVRCYLLSHPYKRKKHIFFESLML